MKKISLIITILIMALSVSAQNSIIGTWKTIDDETGKPKSHVKIFKKGNKFYGVVTKIMDPKKQNARCDECDDDDDRKGKKSLGMEIVRDMEYDADDKEYEDGTILDPNNGKVYTCKMWIDEDDSNKLNVRGYVAFFYRTQNWYRVK